MEGALNPLAGLPDRAGFDALLVREELRRGRTDETMVVALVDVDGLPATGDRYGRESVAALVALCADALQRTLRAVDQLAHTGPGEFSVLLHATDYRRAGIWAGRFEELADRAAAGHETGTLRCSIGMSDTLEMHTLLEAAALARQRMEAVQAARGAQRPRGAGGPRPPEEAPGDPSPEDPQEPG